MYTLKFFCILLILLSTAIAAFIPFFKRIKSDKGCDFPVGEALASGIFLGAGLIHMLSDASNEFKEQGYTYPLAFLLAGSTFLFLLWFEHIGRHMYEHKHDDSVGFTYLSVAILAIHSFLEGTALGFSDSLSLMLVILIAIMAHKWAASFALAVQLNKSTLSLKSSFMLFVIFALMTPIGILSGTATMRHIREFPLLEPVFISLAAGTFLYLGTLHGLKRAVMIEKCCNLKHFSFVVLGFIIMVIVALWT